MNRITDSTQTELMSFLTDEFSGKNIATSDAVKSLLPIGDWSLRRDDAGFVITTTAQAHSQLKAYLDAVFAKPTFEDRETLIYRNDEQHTTVMLNQGKDQTELIVLFWRDSVVQSRIAEAQSNAIKQILDGAVAEVYQLLDDASTEKDEVKQSALFDKALRKVEELGSVLDPSTERHDQ